MSYDIRTEVRIAARDASALRLIFFDDMEDMFECEEMPDGTVTAHMEALEFLATEEPAELARVGIPFVLFHSGPHGIGKVAFDGKEQAEIPTGETGRLWLEVDVSTGQPDPETANAARRYCRVERQAIAVMTERGR